MYSNVKYKKYTSQRRFGVELEMGSGCAEPKSFSKAKVKSAISRISQKNLLVTKYELSYDSQNWHIKDDATCGPFGRLGPKGVEVASFVAKGIKDLQHIADVADGLKNSGFSVNSNCGFHIHAEAKDLTPYNLGVILAYWIKIQSILSFSLPIYRDNNVYCRNILDGKELDRNKKYGALALYTKLQPQNLSYYENDDRRVNLNLVNYARADYFKSNQRKTIELRWPEGTLDGKDIKCWVRLFLNFIDNCKNRPMPDNLNDSTLEETLGYLGLNHESDSFVILSEGLHETKTWFLERILKYGRDGICGYPSSLFLNNALKSAKKTLNNMWYPYQKY
jgi:hypothetical protein